MSFEWGIKDWREDIGEYYDQHFSEEEMEIIYEIIRGNVGMETLREKLKEFFDKNDLVYFMSFRFIGGAGAPFAIQNVLPVLFNMGIKNYFIATLIGGAPAMFVTAALGSGVEKVIDQNSELSFSTAMSSPDIYIPIIAFFFILVISFIIKKFYFKK